LLCWSRRSRPAIIRTEKGSRHPEVTLLENPFGQNPFREYDDIEDAEDARDLNPYTAMEGYEVRDASGAEVGRIEENVYDAPSDVLKYIVVDGHAVSAEGIEVNAEEERVWVPYGREAIESAPALEDPSGEFDRALRAHYEDYEERR
jgi:sporulation protein YlmC with PRC-barrel domain